MVKLTKLSDYGIVIMAALARDYAEDQRCALTAARQSTRRSVREIAELTSIPQPTVSKLVKNLTRSGLLSSHRGVQGGYRLARDPAEVTVIDMIVAIDGPVALTDCSSPDHSTCELESSCPVSGNWQVINQTVVSALASLSLADMTRTLHPADVRVPAPRVPAPRFAASAEQRP